MNYYYDIILNWNELNAYEFFEWNDTDYLELIKKIPLIKIKHREYLDFLTHHVQVSSLFLKELKDKTIINNKNFVNKLTYATLITDGKNVLALEFNSEGSDIARSKLLIDDELNILEIAYNLKEYNLEYTLKEAILLTKDLRQEREAKHLITLEINNLYQNKDLAKLKYLYYELEKQEIDDLDILYNKFLNKLEANLNPDILKLYYLIKLSYNKVS